jgi:amino acid permease
VSTSVNIASGIVGGAFVVIPRSFYAAGFAKGLVMLVGAGLTTAYTGHLLGKCFQHIRGISASAADGDGEGGSADRFTSLPYLCIVRHAFGAAAEAAVGVVMVVQICLFLAFGLLVAGQTAVMLAPGLSLEYAVLTAAAVAFPMCLLRGPAEYWWTQVVALASSSASAAVVIATCVAVLAAGAGGGGGGGAGGGTAPPNITNTTTTTFGGGGPAIAAVGPRLWEGDGSARACMEALGNLMFCYSGHLVFPTLQLDMAQPARFRESLAGAYALILLVFGAVGLAGLAAFGEGVGANVIDSLPEAWPGASRAGGAGGAAGAGGGGGAGTHGLPPRQLAAALLALHVVFVLVQFFGPAAQAVDYAVEVLRRRHRSSRGGRGARGGRGRRGDRPLLHWPPQADHTGASGGGGGAGGGAAPAAGASAGACKAAAAADGAAGSGGSGAERCNFELEMAPSSEGAAASGRPSQGPRLTCARVCTRLGLMAVPVAVALGVSERLFCLGGLIGASTATLMAFVVPCALHLRLFGQRGTGELSPARRALDVAIICAGVLAGLVATYFASACLAEAGGGGGK